MSVWFTNSNITSIVNKIVHAISVMVKGIGVTQTNWAILKNFIINEYYSNTRAVTVGGSGYDGIKVTQTESSISRFVVDKLILHCVH